MRKTKEILRLKFEAGLGNHRIARACGVSASTVWDTLTRFQMTGLSWPLPATMSEAEIERRLYRRPGDPEANPERVPDWAAVQREFRHKHVTLRLLWEEYKAESPDGFQYSWYCERFREWRKRVDIVMRQEHKLGEKVFLDWAGDTIPLTDRETGEVRPCYLFVGTLGASNYTYAEPSTSQDLAAFLQADVRSPARKRWARLRASVRSVFTRMPARLGIRAGAMTLQPTPSEVSRRWVSYPVGPAS